MKRNLACLILIGLVSCWQFLTTAQAQKAFLQSITYRIVDEVMEQDANQIKVSLRIIVSGKLSKSSLRRVLQSVRSEVEARRQFQNNASLISILIWTYVSKAHIHSKELWLASLRQNGKAAFQIRFNEAHLTQLQEPPEVRLGILEASRKEIWQALHRIEQRAQLEALERFPLDAKNLQAPGQFFRLSKRSTLILAEAIVTDPVAEMKGVVSLPPKTTITLIHSIPFENRLWHYVEANDPLKEVPAVGWIDSLTLIHQMQAPDQEYQEQIQRLTESIKFGYQSELSAQYQISLRQLEELFLEGILKNLPAPESD